MPEGPFGNVEVNGPLSDGDSLGLIFRITGRPFENEADVYNNIRTDIIRNVRIRADDVYISPSYNSNVLMVGVQMSNDIEKLGSVNTGSDAVKRYIKNNKDVGDVDYVDVVCGDIEEEVA